VKWSFSYEYLFWSFKAEYDSWASTVDLHCNRAHCSKDLSILNQQKNNSGTCYCDKKVLYILHFLWLSIQWAFHCIKTFLSLVIVTMVPLRSYCTLEGRVDGIFSSSLGNNALFSLCFCPVASRGEAQLAWSVCFWWQAKLIIAALVLNNHWFCCCLFQYIQF